MADNHQLTSGIYPTRATTTLDRLADFDLWPNDMLSSIAAQGSYGWTDLRALPQHYSSMIHCYPHVARNVQNDMNPIDTHPHFVYNSPTFARSHAEDASLRTSSPSRSETTTSGTGGYGPIELASQASFSPTTQQYHTYQPESYELSDATTLPFGGQLDISSQDNVPTNTLPCVALHQVNNHSDHHYGLAMIDNDAHDLSTQQHVADWNIEQQPQEVIYTFDDTSSPTTSSVDEDEDCASDPITFEPDESQLHKRDTSIAITQPNIRHRKTSNIRSRSHATIRLNSAKSHHKRTTSSKAAIGRSFSRAKRVPTKRELVFPCTLAMYGCDSSFKSKNEWKRHIATQHMLFEYWECNECAKVKGKGKPHDYNRKDLFIQHVRRMHPPPGSAPAVTNDKRKKKGKVVQDKKADAAVERIAQACHKYLNPRPELNNCPICTESFSGPSSWDDCVEHVGKHMEDAKKKQSDLLPVHSWHRDLDIQAWLINHKIIRNDRHGQLILVDRNNRT